MKIIQYFLYHDIRNIENNTICIKNYKTIKEVDKNKDIYEETVLDFFKNKKNFLYINWDDKLDYKQKICNFLNISAKHNLEIANESTSWVLFTNNTEDQIMTHYNRSEIVKNKFFRIKNNKIFFYTKDVFYILYFLNKNLIKYDRNISISKYLFHDINNDYITKLLLSGHNDPNNNITNFRMDFFENLFKFVLKDFNLKYKNVLEFGPGDCCFLKYCDNLGSNIVSIDYDKTVEKICKFYNIFHINMNYINPINFRDIWDCYINFDFIYGKSSIDISMPEKNMHYFINNIKKISHDKTKLFYLTWIPINYNPQLKDKNIETLKKNDFEVYLIKKEKVHLFVYPFTENYVISKNINMSSEYFTKC